MHMPVIRSRGGTPSGRVGVPLAAGVAVVLGVAVQSGVQAVSQGNKLLLVVPLAAVIGLALVAVGSVRFELFAFATIAIRSSLDIAKPTTSTGAAGQATASASGLDPAGALAVLFMVAALFWWLTRRSAGLTSPPASVHRIALIAFSGAGFISIIGSAVPTVSLLEAIRVAAVVTMLAVMEVLLVDRRRVYHMVIAIYASALVPVGLTLVNAVFHHSQFSSGGFDRYMGTFSQPNPFAIYLTMLIVMGVAMLPHLERRWRYALIPLLCGSAICLYLTYTRSAWMATVVGVVVVAVVGRRRKMVAMLVVGMVVVLVAVPTVSQRFADLGSSNVNAAGNTSNSLAWRFDYWGQVLPLASKDPVTGIGLKMSSYGTTIAKEPHNDFLRAYVETGVVGIIAYLLLLVSMVMVARQSLKGAAPGFDRSIAIGFTGCVTAFVLISLVSNVITEVIVLWYYVAFAAAAYAVVQFNPARRGGGRG
ncbi:MAG TPA: O-antigen ligase family protein [Candidatus Dormibacteraeota bacterium]